MYRAFRSSVRDVQLDPPAAICERCRQEVYPGEARYHWEGRWICPDCFREALEAADLSTLALELGLEVERYE